VCDNVLALAELVLCVTMYRIFGLTLYPVGFGVIHSEAVEQGFRAVDRRFFVPRVGDNDLGLYSGLID
jgi:hypothetical protein